jgi:hypothetical protein
MRDESTQLDGSVAVATPVAGPSARAGGLALPLSLPFPRRRELALGRTAGRLALASLLVGAFGLVAFATAQQGVLVPRSYLSFPGWEAGPLHFIFRGLPNDYKALNIGLSLLVPAMTLAYAAVLLAVRSLSLRAIVLVILALHAILLLGPPMQLTDLFNYLG